LAQTLALRTQEHHTGVWGGCSPCSAAHAAFGLPPMQLGTLWL
jgi:hypothetical protein